MALTAAFFVLCSNSGGQQPPHATNQQGPSVFHWDTNHIEELDAKDAISLSNKLNATEKRELTEAIAGRITPEDEKVTPETKRHWQQIASQTQIKLVDLNGDGQLDVIAQAVGEDSGCSPTGNCPIWVFRKSGERYKLILEQNVIQTFTIQSTRTNGYRDLVLGTHDSAYEQNVILYKFENGHYVETACYEANWSRMVGDNLVDLKKPDITPCR